MGWTGATIFRNVIFKNGVPEKMLHLENPTCKDSFRGDSFRNLIHLKEGKSYFSADYMAVYRISNDGIWQGSSTIKSSLKSTKMNKIRLFVIDACIQKMTKAQHFGEILSFFVVWS